METLINLMFAIPAQQQGPATVVAQLTTEEKNLLPILAAYSEGKTAEVMPSYFNRATVIRPVHNSKMVIASNVKQLKPEPSFLTSGNYSTRYTTLDSNTGETLITSKALDGWDMIPNCVMIWVSLGNDKAAPDSVLAQAALTIRASKAEDRKRIADLNQLGETLLALADMDNSEIIGIIRAYQKDPDSSKLGNVRETLTVVRAATTLAERDMTLIRLRDYRAVAVKHGDTRKVADLDRQIANIK